MLRPVEALRGWLPRWWRGEGGAGGAALRTVLAPAEVAYRGTVMLRNAAYDRGWLRSARATIPVVSVGNIGVGGAGKTPFAAWLAARLTTAGRRPAIVLRGYGADEIAVHRELNPHVPVVQAPRRARGVEAAARMGCDVAVLDDAFQHRALARDLDVLLVAAESWATRRLLLPRGPWREPADSISRADLVVVTRKSISRHEASLVADAVRAVASGIPFAVCHLRPTRLIDGLGAPVPLEWLDGRRVLAVASLADPEPFVRQLRAAGAEPHLLAFPDHHEFSPSDLRLIERTAAARPLVCTRKEAVKLRPLSAGGLPILVLEQEVVIEEGAQVIESLLDRVADR